MPATQAIATPKKPRPDSKSIASAKVRLFCCIMILFAELADEAGSTSTLDDSHGDNYLNWFDFSRRDYTLSASTFRTGVGSVYLSKQC